ncbi:MAG: hypothetical protein EHM40_01495 [Chloroflexi bacterium]|nr:MAG: hypothetical protein EHM40_01495 [Chloroflexota bacterium]
MDVLGKRLAGEAALSGELSLSIPKRLGFALEKLNEAHYMARWEAGAEGPHVILGICPYAAIIEKHPELCQMDAAMLAEWMGQPAAQIFRTGKEGSSVCVFALGNKAPPSVSPIA